MKLVDWIFREPCAVSFGRRSGGGVLAVVRESDSATLLSSDGTATTIPAADEGLSGVMKAGDRVLLGQLSNGLQSGGIGRLPRVGAIEGTAFGAETQALRVEGFAAPGDGGGGVWRRAPGQPAHGIARRSADRHMPDGSVNATGGGWWELVFAGRHDIRQAGATCDGVADDTAAMQAMADFLAAKADSTLGPGATLGAKRQAELVVPRGAGAVITGTVTVLANIRVTCEGPVLVGAPAGAVPPGDAWLVIGRPTTNNQPSRKTDHVIDIRRVPLSDWSSPADVGCEITVVASRVHLERVDGFARGVKLTAAYSTVTLGEFRDNGVGLTIRHRTGANQFTNATTVIGGEFACLSTTNPGLSRYGISIEEGGLGTNVNGLAFTGQSYELNAAGAAPGEAVPVLVANTWTVRMTEQRTEGNSDSFARLSGDCRHIFIRTYGGKSALDDRSAYRIGNVIWAGDEFDPSKGYPVFDSGRLTDRLYRYSNDAGQQWAFRDLEYLQNQDPPRFRLQGSFSAIDHAAGTVTLSTGIFGIRVDASRCKSFAVIRTGPAGQSVALALLGFRADGTQATGTGDILKSAATPTQTPNAGIYGGLYNDGSELTGSQTATIVTVGPEVTTLFIGLQGNGSAVTGFKVYGVGDAADWWSVSRRDFEGRAVVKAAPSFEGAWQHGQVAWAESPAAGTAPGWVCVRGGQFGTLNGGATTATGTSGNAYADFSSVAGLREGFHVTIDGTSYRIRWIEGLRVWFTTALGTSPAGAAVANTQPEFRAMPALAS